MLAAVGAHLARYEMPVSVTVVDALPRTASGKADLAAVRELIAAAEQRRRERRQGVGVRRAAAARPWSSWRARCVTSPTPCSRSSSRRRSSKRCCRRCRDAQQQPRGRRRRPISVRASATIRRPIGACTSTTATTSVTTTRASRSTTLERRRATTVRRRTARSSSPSLRGPARDRARRASSRCSSTACSRSSTATLGLAGKTAELSVRFRRPTPLLTPLTYRAERVVDDRRITATRRAASSATTCCARRTCSRPRATAPRSRPSRPRRPMSTPTTVSRVLRAHVAERPDADYVVCDDDRLTYADAEAPQPRARARAARGGRRARQPDRTAVPDRCRTSCSRGWPRPRIGAIAVPISTFSTVPRAA